MTAYIIITLIFKCRLAPAGERRISFTHMRLSEKEQLKIVQAVRVADPEAKIWLFGSRVHDDRKGGDIDIAILSQTIRRSERAQIRRAITDCIGEQQIDIVVSDTGAEPFFRHASDLRNDIAHEYETDKLAELFGSTLELTPVLLSIAQAIFRYCREKGYQSV